MDNSTEYPVKVRRHSLRVLCMLMLVLMHLDIYGGSVMSFWEFSVLPVACQEANSFSDAGAEVTVGSVHEEWEDFDYRRQTLRHPHLCRPVFYVRTVLPVLQDMPCESIHFSPLQDTFSYSDADVCLFHCLLII
ncbi:MAG TPA: hypothetical protein H9819_08110 [Candidatus Bacteroides merdipullorum]|uniref:Uncharacterized protein n=1 Tax=Candidatus Bacteroides merdipullorum TaxID=2838474 RepID=A0A9D2CWF3_9BACE|nr:hypothetical protein [Candidatus Bacteroides merdipullorum]